MLPQILIAEDDVVAGKVLSRALRDLPCSMVRASNGRRAWEILLDNPDTSLLITDMKMPDMGGRELIQATRSHPLVRNIPIIIVSGIAMPREISDLLMLGCSRFLPKPINTSHLRQYVIELLDLRCADRSPQRGPSDNMAV